METRAKFVLIGAFTLLGFLGILGFFLWFARVELDQQFAYYDIRFSSVAGLSEASDVRFAGLPVGQVVDVRLAPDRDGTILVRVEVDAETPVRTTSIATIESLGVTGVSYVAIGPGIPSTDLLEPTPDLPTPEIVAGRSALQSLTEGAPELIEETLSVVEDLGEIFNEENQARIEGILVNVEQASESLAATLDDFSEMSGPVTSFADALGNFALVLEGLTDDLEAVLRTADETLAAIGELTDDAELALTTGTEALTVARDTIAAAEGYISGDLTATTEELRTTLTELRAEIAALGTRTGEVLDTFDGTGVAATARLDEAEATLAAIDTLLAEIGETVGTVDAAAARFDRLLETEGGPLLSETRTAIAEATTAIRTIGAAAETDLPAIVADIRAATETANRVIAEVAEDLSGASGRIEGLTITTETTLTQVTETFANANTTLTAINDALETGDRALDAAERAFAGADRVINEDIDGIVTGLEESLGTLNSAIAQISDDLPRITADLSAASESAEEAFDGLQAVIATATPGVADFTRNGLPLYTRLADEAQGLIRSLDRLTRQIERDPARFFLDRDAPEFQR